MKATGRPRRVIQAIVRRLVEEYQPEKIILFGSYAWGQPTADSDIDLLVVKQTEANYYDRHYAARKALTDPKRFVGLDLLVLTPSEIAQRLAAGDQFVEDVLDTGQVLYER